MEILVNHIRTGISDAVRTQVRYIAFAGIRYMELWLKMMGYY